MIAKWKCSTPGCGQENETNIYTGSATAKCKKCLTDYIVAVTFEILPVMGGREAKKGS